MCQENETCTFTLYSFPVFPEQYELKVASTERAEVNGACDKNQMDVIKQRTWRPHNTGLLFPNVYCTSLGAIAADAVHANALIFAAGMIYLSHEVQRRVGPPLSLFRVCNVVTSSAAVSRMKQNTLKQDMFEKSKLVTR